MSSTGLEFIPKKRKPRPLRPATRELLNRAKNLIENVGWYQGYFSRLDTSGQVCGYCIMGALRQARNEELFGEYSAAYHYIMDKLGVETRVEIFQYNDDPGRTKEEVLALFDVPLPD
jgi:hypothetical protein